MTLTRSERAAFTRQKLLDAAIEQFFDKPYDEVSVHDVAHAAGVAYGLVAHHFGSKRGIYLAAMRESANRLDVTPPPLPDAAPAEQLRHIARAYFASIQEHPAAFLGLMRGGIGADRESREIFEQSRWRAIDGVGALLGLDTKRAALRVTLRSWIGAVDEAAVIWLLDGRPFAPDDVIEMLIACLAVAIREAARLDPSIETTAAVAALE